MRNHPDTIKDAQQMELQDFVYKYKETLTTEEVLSTAYFDIRKRHPLPEAPVVEERITQKSVTFKVIKKEPPPAPISETLIEVKTEVVENESGKKTRIRLSAEQTIQRDTRIKELLNSGKIAKEIIEIMAGEGFTVHAPQVTAVKNKK